MKITQPDGSSVEITNKEDIELYRLFTATPSQENGQVVENEKTVRMRKYQYDTYTYLVDNDCEEGIPIDAVARHFEISQGAAQQRLAVMARNGLIVRVGTGRYRAE